MTPDDFVAGHSDKRPQGSECYGITRGYTDPFINDLACQAMLAANVSAAAISIVGKKERVIAGSAGANFFMDAGKNFLCNLLTDKPVYVEVEDALNCEPLKFSHLLLQEPVMRFIGKMPIVDKRGEIIGSICLMDVRRKKLSQEQIDSIASLSVAVTRYLESMRN